MTIVTICTLVLNVVIAVLLVGYGLWLRNIFTHQLSAKDTTIETLNAAIKLHETEIAGLKGDRAPAIVKDYKAMKEHAEQVTLEKQQLDERMQSLTETQRRMAAVHEVDVYRAELQGLRITTVLLMRHLGNYVDVLNAPEPPQEGVYHWFVNGIRQIIEELHSDVGSRLSYSSKYARQSQV